MRIAFCEFKQWEAEFIQQQPEAAGWEMEFSEGTADELSEGAKASAEVLSCFIRSAIDGALLDQCPELKLIATRSAGSDHIDLAQCEARGITVCNVPQYGEKTVAEHTFGLILALSRNIYWAVDRMKRGDLSIEGLLGFDLYGKTLGVIGAGRIGLRVIRMGAAMSMRVLAYDMAPQSLLAEVMGFEYADLDQVLSEADVVSVHVPLLDSTRAMLNAETLALMKPTAVIVNTSRGSVIDSKALLDALNEGRLAGAALDVLAGEDVISEDRVLGQDISLEDLQLAVEAYQLMHHPKVLVTSHIGFYSREALDRILQTTVENVTGFGQGLPRNIVALRR